jgi:hypothetical protein
MANSTGKSMKQSTSGWMTAAIFLLAAAPAAAAPIVFSGERNNISPGGMLGGRCGDTALTISFAPDAFAASGSSTLGDFGFTASHCIAGFPPGPYTDGEFVWDFGDGTLEGSYVGELAATGMPGQFSISETISFTGGTGRLAGATGSASFTGLLQFGMFEGAPASYGSGSFVGTLDIAAVPEPGTWSLLLAGGAALAAMGRRRAAYKGRSLAAAQ